MTSRHHPPPALKRAPRPASSCPRSWLPLVLGLVISHLSGGAITFATPTAVSASGAVTVRILATSDLHGEIAGHDHLADRPAARGLPALAPLIERYRAGAESLLVDVGDTLTGSPLTFVAWQHRCSEGWRDLRDHPMITAMNRLGYAAMVVGNHDFDFGRQWLRDAERQATFPWLGGNVRSVRGPRFRPWIIRQVGGVRVGLVGVTTPSTPSWVDPDAYAGFTFTDPLIAVREGVAAVRTRGADLVVVLAHLGMGVHPETGAPAAIGAEPGNVGERFAIEVPGIDGIVLGHTHAAVASTVAGVPVVQAKALGTHLAVLEFDLRPRPVTASLPGTRARSPRGYEVIARRGLVAPVPADARPDPDLLTIAAPWHQATQAWLNTPIGTAPVELRTWGAAFTDLPLVELILQAMIEASAATPASERHPGRSAPVPLIQHRHLSAMFSHRLANGRPTPNRAEIAFTSLPLGSVVFPASTIRIREVARLLPYDNRLVVATLTGRQIRLILEHAARFYLDYHGQTSQADLINRSMFYFQCDVVAGVEPVFDLTRPVGQRVVSLTRNGRPVADDERFRVVVGNYRFNGGGDYPGWPEATEVIRTRQDTRGAVIDKIRRDGTIDPTVRRWRRFLPKKIETLPSRPPGAD